MCCGKKKDAKQPTKSKEDLAGATPVVTPMAAPTTPAPTSNDQLSKDNKASEHPSNDGATIEQRKPKVFEHDAKQEQIKQGKRVAKAQYPTMGDVESDWGSAKDEETTQKDSKENSKEASKNKSKQISKDEAKKAENKTSALDPTQE